MYVTWHAVHYKGFCTSVYRYDVQKSDIMDENPVFEDVDLSYVKCFIACDGVFIMKNNTFCQGTIRAYCAVRLYNHVEREKIEMQYEYSLLEYLLNSSLFNLCVFEIVKRSAIRQDGKLRYCFKCCGYEAVGEVLGNTLWFNNTLSRCYWFVHKNGCE